MKKSRIVWAAEMHFVVALIWRAERERRDSGWTQSSSRAGRVMWRFRNSMTGRVLDGVDVIYT